MDKKTITCEEAKVLMMGLIDNELNAEQTVLVKDHLALCPACSEQYKSFINLKEGTSAMKFKNLPDMYWDEYWNHVYNKIERGIGWIFLSIGAIILLTYAGYSVLENFFADQSLPLIMKLGIGILVLGLAVLFVSVIREKLMIRKVDKYRSVKR
jgi:hypothetical protein